MENNNALPQGNQEDTLQDRLKTWEGEKRGLLKDLQGERDKRHQLEQRLEQLEATLNSAEVVPEDVQLKVQRLSQDPDSYIASIVEERIKPVKKLAEDLVVKDQFDRAYRWIAKKEGKDVEIQAVSSIAMGFFDLKEAIAKLMAVR